MENLKKRLIDIQPCFSMLVKSDSSYEAFRQIGNDTDGIPRILYFHKGSTRSLDWKLITQEFRMKALFAEILADSYQVTDIPAIAQQELQLPFIIVERNDQSGMKDIEIHTSMDKYEDIRESLDKTLDRNNNSM